MCIRVHAVYRQMLRIRNTFRADKTLAANLIATDMCGYDIIFGMPWLTRQNPDVHWDQNSWF
jgi:hypothetical protein